MIKIIRHMMQPNHNQRPNVGGLLNFVAIDRIIKERKVKPRDNYLVIIIITTRTLKYRILMGCS